MNNVLRSGLIMLFVFSLGACSTVEEPKKTAVEVKKTTPIVLNEAGETVTPLKPVPVSNQPIGGTIYNAMDSLDKTKMSRALDKGTGKTTEWSNPITQTDYAVTPIRKVVMNGGSCREYKVDATRTGETKEYKGVACIGADGNWQSVER